MRRYESLFEKDDYALWDARTDRLREKSRALLTHLDDAHTIPGEFYQGRYGRIALNVGIREEETDLTVYTGGIVIPPIISTFYKTVNELFPISTDSEDIYAGSVHAALVAERHRHLDRSEAGLRTTISHILRGHQLSLQQRSTRE